MSIFNSINKRINQTIQKTTTATSFDPMKPRDNITIENRILSFLPSDNLTSVSHKVSPVSHRASLRLTLQGHQQWGFGWNHEGKRYSKRIAGETPPFCAPPSLPPRTKRQRRPSGPSPRRGTGVACTAITTAFQKFLCSRRHDKLQEDLTKWKKKWKTNTRRELKSGPLPLALGEYTTQLYQQINPAMRSGTVENLEERVQKVIENAKKALTLGIRSGNLKVCKKECLYRGSGSLPFVPQVGATICDKAFHSTTWKLSATHHFLNKNLNEATARYLFVYTSHFHGVHIKQFSREKSEEEVLFAPNTTFRITSVLPGYTVEGVEGSVTRVELREMC